MASKKLPTLAGIPMATFEYASGALQEIHCTVARAPRNDPDGYDVRVSDPVRPRAAKIFRLLIKRLQQRGFTTEVLDEGHIGGTYCTGRGVRFQMYLQERFSMQRIREVEVFDPKVVWIPNGGLRLVARIGYSEHRFEESKRKGLLEDQIDAMIKEIVAAVDAVALRHQADAAKEEEQREMERERVAREMECRAEDERFQKLRNDALAWQEAKIVRSYLDAVEQGCGDETDEATVSWLEWARREVERRDPLQSLRHGLHDL